MKKTKKILSLLMAILMTFSVFSSISLTAFANTYYESEDNDEYSRANYIGINSTIYGKSDDYYDNDWYKFTVDKNAKVDINFSYSIGDDGYWNVYLYKITNGSRTCISDIEPYAYDEGSESFCTQGLPKGTYYIFVDSCIENYKYNITVTVSYVSNWETELNNTYGTADALTLGKTKYATSNDYYDDDWYKFTLTNDAKVDIKFAYANGGDDYWNVYLYKITNGSKNCISEIEPYAYEGRSKSFCTQGLPKGTYYIYVDSCIERYKYNITVTASYVTNWETEPNNTYGTADTLTLGQTRYAASNDTYDDDWYKFTLTNDAKVNIKFAYANGDDGYWNVYLYKISNGSKTCIADIEPCAYEGTSKSFYTQGLPKGTYYILVDPCIEEYKYNITVSASYVSNWETELNNTYGTADTLTLGKTRYAMSNDYYDDDWYKLKLSKKTRVSIGFNHSKTSKSGSWYVALYKLNNGSKVYVTELRANSDEGIKVIDKTLSAGTYYIEVSPDITGVQYTLNAIQVTTPKAVTLSSLSATTDHKIKATWKKSTDTITGYQVYWAKDKSFSKVVKKATISKASTVTSTASGFSKGTTYYVKVRAYRTINGKTYYGTWSNIKSIKAK